jgi:hypothetical protein
MFSPVVEGSTIQQNFVPYIGTNPYVETAPKGCCIYVKTSKFFLEFFVPLFVARGAKPHNFQRFVVVLVMTL